MNKPSPFLLIVLISRTLVHSGALERITTDHTDLRFELGLGPDGTMARALWRLARLAAAHFCARGIYISIFQRPIVSERSALAAGGGLDDVPAAYLILRRGIGSRLADFRFRHSDVSGSLFWPVGPSVVRSLVCRTFSKKTNDDHGRPSADAGQRRRAIAHGQALTSPPANNDDSPSCGCHFAPLAIDRSD